MNAPRILVAGLRGGSGKTLISLGIAAAWRKSGSRVVPFKKGPDYIDASWLSLAAGGPCRSLDLFLMSPERILRSFTATAPAGEVSVIEGNRGLYDGLDPRGSYSTAELAKLLRAPVILTVDCTKATRTVAASVLGCQHLDPEVHIAGVVLNRVAGARHENVLRSAVEQDCGLPVLGSIGKLRRELFPERHLGLVPPDEHDRIPAAIERAAAVAREQLDLAAIRQVANSAPAMLDSGLEFPAGKPESVRIGVFRDAAFSFYYPENLEALTREGARLVEVSPLKDSALPDLDGLYIGGGFPETLAPLLAQNEAFLASVHSAVESGLPVYAECGGAVFLGEQLRYDGSVYDMAGALPVAFGFGARPTGHGYTELTTVRANPFYRVGESVRGHEFHYTYLETPAAGDLTFAFRVDRGYGCDGEHDGLCHRNVLACYTHVHASGTETWAPALVAAAHRFKSDGNTVVDSAWGRI